MRSVSFVLIVAAVVSTAGACGGPPAKSAPSPSGSAAESTPAPTDLAGQCKALGERMGSAMSPPSDGGSSRGGSQTTQAADGLAAGARAVEAETPADPHLKKAQADFVVGLKHAEATLRAAQPDSSGGLMAMMGAMSQMMAETLPALDEVTLACHGAAEPTPTGSCPLAAPSCWSSAVAEAQACAAGAGARLDADLKTCKLGGGAVATFDAPVAFPIVLGATKPSVTITKDGATCARVARDDSGVTLETKSGKYRVENAEGQPGIKTTCADGSTSTVMFKACALPGGGNRVDFTNVPRAGVVSTDDSVGVLLGGFFPGGGGASPTAVVRLFECAKP
jgi:hypothetical protein